MSGLKVSLSSLDGLKRSLSRLALGRGAGGGGGGGVTPPTGFTWTTDNGQQVFFRGVRVFDDGYHFYAEAA